MLVDVCKNFSFIYLQTQEEDEDDDIPRKDEL